MQSVAIAFPAVCFSHGVTNYLCKAITGAAPRLFIFAWDSVTVTPIHTLAICLSFTLTSPIRLSPSTFYAPIHPPTPSPSSVMNSFSHVSLPITSPFLFILSFLSVSSFHPSNKRLCRGRIWSSSRQCRNTLFQQRRPFSFSPPLSQRGQEHAGLLSGMR